MRVTQPSGEPANASGPFTVPLQAGVVTQLQFDYALGLTIDGTINVQIGGLFSYGREGDAVTYDPEQTSSLGPLLVLRSLVVTEVVAGADGSLSMQFADGTSITVPPDQHYEPFTIRARDGVGQSGFLVVSVPGGGLAIWDQQSE